MTSGIRTITYPVKDLDAAKALYTELLGVAPYVDQPYYVGFRPAEGPEIGLDPNGHAQGLTAPVTYWHTDDIKAAIAALVEAGAAEEQAVRDVGAGNLTATVRDADGNVTGLFQSQ
jgi:catechol 2,3-dioxygenase-like lactoylglutathione lyase family enzyme